MGLQANFIRFSAVQNFWKSVRIWQSYGEFKGGNIFWDTNVDCAIVKSSLTSSSCDTDSTAELICTANSTSLGTTSTLCLSLMWNPPCRCWHHTATWPLHLPSKLSQIPSTQITLSALRVTARVLTVACRCICISKLSSEQFQFLEVMLVGT